ncbi:MAG: hypothetical protein QOD86_2326 [Miltoncostaeaceae bacterium]|jgi:hypothetical protein|nr:hypothetical protein [Miltoncostaeaceae bacterium]
MIGLPAMTEPRAYTVVRLTRVVASFLLALGLVGLLRTLSNDVSGDDTITFFKLVIHPVSCGIYLALGLVGVAAGTTARRSQRFLARIAGVMLLYAVLGQILRGTPDNAFSGAASVLLLHLGLAIVAGAAVWLPDRASAPIAPPDATVPVEEIPAPSGIREAEAAEATVAPETGDPA